MGTHAYTNPATGEVVTNPDIRPFDEILAELSDGSTLNELSDNLWELIQRVQDTGKSGHLTLTIAIGADGAGRLVVKDEVKVKLPEFNRPTTSFFLDKNGNPSRRDPNQPELPNVTRINRKDA